LSPWPIGQRHRAKPPPGQASFLRGLEEQAIFPLEHLAQRRAFQHPLLALEQAVDFLKVRPERLAPRFLDGTLPRGLILTYASLRCSPFGIRIGRGS